jgi:hypothetical protein
MTKGQITFEQLNAVRQEVADYMPKYNIKRVDPFDALEDRVGNCFAKAAIGSGLLVVRHGVEPAVAYSSRLHGTPRSEGMLATQGKNMAHIATLVPVISDREGYIPGLCFGVEGKTGKKVVEEDLGDIIDYNESVILAEPGEDGVIAATPDAQEQGLYVGDWREGVNRYLEALDRKPIDTDELVERVAETFLSADRLKKVV